MWAESFASGLPNRWVNHCCQRKKAYMAISLLVRCSHFNRCIKLKERYTCISVCVCIWVDYVCHGISNGVHMHCRGRQVAIGFVSDGVVWAGSHTHKKKCRQHTGDGDELPVDWKTYSVCPLTRSLIVDKNVHSVVSSRAANRDVGAMRYGTSTARNSISSVMNDNEPPWTAYSVDKTRCSSFTSTNKIAPKK